jgi:hypothetical protein
MTPLAWLAHVLTATAWLAFHLVVGTGLMLLSANVATQPGAEAGVVFVRLFATLWVYVAAWKWVVRGVLARPEPPSQRKKPTGAEVARSSLGCLANLVPIPILYRLLGHQADLAWAGLTGPDPRHPARRAAEQGLAALYFVVDHADQWVPVLIGTIFMLIPVAIFRAVRRQKRHRDGHVDAANAATLAKLRARKAGQPAQAAGHRVADAHRVPTGPPSPPAPGAGRQDVVLGQLTWSSAESAWWGQREDGFPVLVHGTPDGPDAAALTQAHQVVQRSFEVLLRASEAARPEAQSRGVGLSRFTIAAAHVSGKDTRLHLRCDADAGHDYVVRSTDGLLTFATRS